MSKEDLAISFLIFTVIAFWIQRPQSKKPMFSNLVYDNLNNVDDIEIN